jgi:hypothetical protein
MDLLKKIAGLFCRGPDVIIGGMDRPYLLRWHVIPRNRFFNIYLHKFLRDDDDRALHDHPWWSCSVILRRGYWEHIADGRTLRRKPLRAYFRKATDAHRIELLRPRFWIVSPDELSEPLSAWSLFITGPKVREWGFHCPKGWVHWKTFCSPHDTTVSESDLLGRGCE